jgi:carboxymethylenebutenolidase
MFCSRYWLPAAAMALVLSFPLPGQAQSKQTDRTGIKDHFPSRGEQIPIEHFEPKQPGRYPAVLLVHGIDGLEESGRIYRGAASRLANKGYVVLLVHYFQRTGTDPSRAKALLKPMQNFLAGKPVEDGDKRQILSWFRQWQETIADAVAYARSRPNVRPDRVGLVGFSLGAFLSVTVAADEKNGISAVVDFFGGLPSGLEPRKLPPALILHSDQDRIVPVESAYQLRDLIGKKGGALEMKVYPGVGHLFQQERGGFNLLAASDAEGCTHRFLDQHLNGVPDQNLEIASKPQR